MDKVIAYSFGENFIEKAADYLLDNYCKGGYDLSRVACVFEGKRPALFLCKKLSEKIKKPFLPPKIYSIDEFIEYIAVQGPLKRLSGLDNAYVVYNLVKKHAPSMFGNRGGFEFCAFLPWAKEIISFIEQLDLEDIRDKALETVEKSAAIGYEVPQSINTLLKNIVKIRAAYHKFLNKNNFYSRGFAYLNASKKAAQMSFDEFDKVIFCNFFYLYSTQEKVIKEICEKGRGTCIFQGSQDEWQVLKDNAKNLGSPINPKKEVPRPNLSFYQGFDMHSQACIVREILNNKVKEAPGVLIAVPRPEAITPLLGEISPILNEFNISMGYPLKRSPLYVLLDALLRAQESKRNGAYYTKDYLNLLRHPLIKNLKFKGNTVLRRVMVHKIEELARGLEESSIGGSLFLALNHIEKEEKIYELTLKTLQSMNIKTNPVRGNPSGLASNEVSIQDCKEALNELHSVLFKAWDQVSSFGEFADKLDGLIDVLMEKSAFAQFRFNLKAVEKLREIKEEFESASFSAQKFEQSQIWDVFRRKLQDETIAFTGSPLRGAQVLGLLEARSLNFDNVIVMDVNESVLPKLKVHEPLIPREVMLSLGVRKLEKEEEIQRYHFMRLILSAKNAHLIYEENREKEKSRFIEELLWRGQRQARKLETASIPKASFSIKTVLSSESVKKTEDMVEFLKAQVYSASRINTYLSCPLQFYYRYVLGLKEREDLLDEPQAPHIGNFIHELLEDTFNRFKGSKPLIDKKFKAYFFETLDKKFEKDIAGRMKSDSFLLKGIIVNRMGKFLDSEVKRDVNKIICLEEKRREQITVNGLALDFVYTADRVDEMKDKSIVVIDYKTGKSGLVPKKLSALENMSMDRESIKEGVKSFQLPLYYHFTSKDFPEAKVNAEVYSLRVLKREAFIQKGDFGREREIMRLCFEALSAVFAEIFDVNAAFEPDKNERRCRFCGFKGMCR